MPYEVAFTKQVKVADPEAYINDCCWGGDVVTGRLLPVIEGRYEDIRRNQEDWGWFIWFRKGKTALAVDVYCDEPGKGVFRIHLTSRRRRWLVLDRVVDTPELEELKALVVGQLESWVDSGCKVTRLDSKYVPVGERGRADTA